MTLNCSSLIPEKQAKGCEHQPQAKDDPFKCPTDTAEPGSAADLGKTVFRQSAPPRLNLSESSPLTKGREGFSKSD